MSWAISVLKFTYGFGDEFARFKFLCSVEYVHTCDSSSLLLMANLKQIPLLSSTLIPGC